MIIFTVLALLAFAANSVLCRLALGGDAIDAASFTVIRLLSGAVVLFLIIKCTQPGKKLSTYGGWTSSLWLLTYAVTFSYAYITLDTGTGALILFGSVQITMILLAVVYGARLHYIECLGLVIAFIGFVYLVLPGVTTPSVSGFILMVAAGVSWGMYTLKGRGSQYPLLDTAANFFRTIPFIILLSIITFSQANYTYEGIVLALLSGGITSGLGYTLWYSALSGLTVTRAAALQLLVPLLAALGGVIFVSEVITVRLLISAIMVVGGILMVILSSYCISQYKLGEKK